MTSFRAEAAALLHGLIAVGHILRSLAINDNRLLDLDHLFTNDEISSSIHVYSDSQSLIIRLNDWRTYPDLYPSVGLSCDSDYCLEIIGLLKHEFHQANVTMSHVCGHQDEKKPWDQLTWPEKLNCHCDKRASHVLNNASHHDRPSSATLAYHKLDFLSRNQVITNRLPTTIRRIYGSTDMRTYLCRKFSWKPSTCDLIDWLCHG